MVEPTLLPSSIQESGLQGNERLKDQPEAPYAEARTPYLAIIVPHEFLSVTKVRCFNAKILVARLSFKIAPSIGELCFGLSAHCRGLMSVTLS